MILIHTLALLAQGPHLTVLEPTLPDTRLQSWSVSCGSERIEVSNYGAALPTGQEPSLVTQRGALGGSSAEGLKRDLARQAAAYRLTGQCLRGNRGIWFQLFTGEQREGQIEYGVVSAVIRDGQVVEYSGPQPSNAETFWFR